MNESKYLEVIDSFQLNFTLRWTQMCDTRVTSRTLLHVLVFLHKICSELHPTLSTNAWEEHGLELAQLPLTSVAEVEWISSFIYLSIYGSTALCWMLAAFPVSWSFYTVGRTPWTGDQPSQSRYLHTEQHKHRINTNRHPCLKWDSNPRSQRSSERRLFML
jgi:hypothetical protein